MDLSRVSNEPLSEETPLGSPEVIDQPSPPRVRQRRLRATVVPPAEQAKNGAAHPRARRAARSAGMEESVERPVESSLEEKSDSLSSDELIDRALVVNDPEELPGEIEPEPQWSLAGNAQAFAFDRQMRAYADDLKHVLATLAKGHSVKRSTQRIVVAGVNTDFDASRVAWGLALTSAGSGFRVLLVDSNLHRPAVHAQFGVSNDFGLTDLLYSSEAPHRFPQSTPVPNLAVITAGPKLSVYAGLLSREQLFHRLQPLARYFDYIIVDAARLTPALVGRVSEGADNVIVTAKQHGSSMRELATLVRTLRDAGAPEASVLMLE